jgi:uncharacterized membrane protein YhdT
MTGKWFTLACLAAPNYYVARKREITKYILIQLPLEVDISLFPQYPKEE